MGHHKPPAADDAGWIVAITTVAATGLVVGSHLPPRVALTAGVLAVALVLGTVALAVRKDDAADDDLYATPPLDQPDGPDPQTPQRRAIAGGFFTFGAGSTPAAFLGLGWPLGLVYIIGVVVAAVAVAALTHHIAKGRTR